MFVFCDSRNLNAVPVEWGMIRSISLNKSIENVQLEASRIVTGGTRPVSHNNLYMETDWEKLKDRREKHKLVQFYKMTKYLTPHYIIC
jgi:hypothetical protein